MELDLNIGQYKLFKRTLYSKLQVSTKDNLIITNTKAGEKLLADYEKQISFPKSYFNTEDGILNDFDNENDLMYIFVPENITHISHSAFANSNVYSIHFPDGLLFLGPSAFKDCHYLGSIEIPKLIKRLEDNTFDGCLNLKEVSLPDGILLLGQYAFNGCYGLSKLHVPDTVRKIDSYAFCNCLTLKEINIPRDFESFGKTPFLSSGIKTLIFNHNLMYHEKDCYSDALKFSKIDEIVIDKNVEYLDFQILSPIKYQIKQIKYNGTFEEFKSFAFKNSVLIDELSGKRILFDNGLESLIKNKGKISDPENKKEITEAVR